MNLSAQERPLGIIAICLASLTLLSASGQGTITFDANPWWNGTSYYELGMEFNVIIPGSGSAHDDMLIIPASGHGSNLPSNSTAYMIFYQQLNPDNYASLGLANGSPFGLTSVRLADPTSPSSSPVSISFVGHLPGGATVTDTFTTPGNGATTFAGYSFSPAFASGLTSVDILAPRWAMDNLSFTVPEPSVAALALATLLALACRTRQTPLR